MILEEIMRIDSNAIVIENLTCKFGDLIAVDHLSLCVPKGIVFGFLGQNGAGKTTTIRMLLGLLEPDGGTASILGYDISTQAQAIREHTGALLEHNGLYEQMTAYENLEYFARIFRLSFSERKARIFELLTHLSLWDRRNDLIGTWSKGMRQKLAVTRSILHHPSLVILDEPTSGLDPLAAVDLREDLLSLKKKEGTTIFLNTHNLPEAEKLCDLVGIIDRGRLLVVAPPKELIVGKASPYLEISGTSFSQGLVDCLLQHPAVNDVQVEPGHLRIHLTDETIVNELIALVAKSGANIQAVSRGNSSLESVFVDLVRKEHL
jgi:ABC-2 type transport system ATP-binding protein